MPVNNKPTSSLPDHLITRSKSENHLKNRVIVKKYNKNSSNNSDDDEDDDEDDDSDAENDDDDDGDSIFLNNTNTKSSSFKKKNSKSTKRISFKGTFLKCFILLLLIFGDFLIYPYKIRFH